MINHIIMYLIINNLMLIYFSGLEDLKLKNNYEVSKKYLTIFIISLINYCFLFHLYKILDENNILFLIPIVYVFLSYILIFLIKSINEFMIIYNNKKFEYSSELIISSSSLVLLTFFAIDKGENFFEGIEVLILSTISIYFALVIFIVIKRNLEKNDYFKIFKYEPMYFFILFVLSLIPSIIKLILNGEL